MMSKKPILTVHEVSMFFGGLKAVDDLSFTINEKEIIGLIGPNGAGKTTVFNCVTQFYKKYTGTITYVNRDNKVINLKDYDVTKIASLGIARTFQNIELIPDLSILDNVLIGAFNQFETKVIAHIFRTPKMRRQEKALTEKAENILKRLHIHHLKDMYVAGQPYGILKKVELARALISDPRLIILDEPAAGLNDKETDELEALVYQIRDEFNTTVLLIEHDMGLVMNLCDRVVAINFGKFLAYDTPQNIQKNPLVQEAYLGKDE